MDLMNGSMFDYAVCAAVICLLVYGWGRFRRFIACEKFRKAHPFLIEKKYKEAIVIYQEVASDMQGEPAYWYNLAVALAGAGSSSDARSALGKLFLLAPEHEEGARLREALDQNEKKEG